MIPDEHDDQPTSDDQPDVSTRAPVRVDAVAATADLATRAKRDLERVQEQVRSAQMIEKFCSALEAELRAGHSSEALRVIRGNSKAISALRERSTESAQTIAAIESQLKPEVEAAFAGLIRTFPAAAQEAGLEVDRSSRHPTYTMCDGFITVGFEKRRLETRIQPRDGRRTTLGVDPPVVIEHLRGEVDRLFKRPFAGVAVMGQIEMAYGTIIKEKGRKIGEAVPLKELLAQLSRDKAFRADEFNVDLSRLVRNEGGGADRIRLDHSRDSKNGLLLWQLEQRGYYGYIRIGGE